MPYLIDGNNLLGSWGGPRGEDDRRAEVVRCQYLIADTYNRHYDIVFSNDSVDLNAKIEPYPDRYVMGLVDGQIVAAAGLYLHNTYVERYGRVTDDEIRAVIEAAGASDRYPTFSKREYTKLVVHRDWEGRGIGRVFFAATHSRDFLNIDRHESPILVSCAKLSVFRGLYDKVGIRSRTIKAFPAYRVHELYRSADDPMESRLILPEVDIDARWYDAALPWRFQLARAERGPR